MKTRHKHAELIKEWADGAEIEYWSPTYGRWQESITITWDVNYQYRIKPEPKRDVVKFYGCDAYNKEIYRVLPTEQIELKITFDGETGKLKKAEIL